MTVNWLPADQPKLETTFQKLKKLISTYTFGQTCSLFVQLFIQNLMLCHSTWNHHQKYNFQALMDSHRITVALSIHNLQLLLAKVIFHQYLEILSQSVCNFWFILCFCYVFGFRFFGDPLTLPSFLELTKITVQEASFPLNPRIIYWSLLTTRSHTIMHDFCFLECRGRLDR